MSSVIISLHALTGADEVSGFYRHSKKTIYEKVKKVKKVKKPNNSLQNLGMYDILSEEDIKKCSMFLINFIYADKTILTISQARGKKWKAMKNKTTLRLPPDEDSFEQHLLRANYQAQIWYNFANSDAPSNDDFLCYSSSSDDDYTVFTDFLKCFKCMIYTRCSFHCSFILTICVWKVLWIWKFTLKRKNAIVHFVNYVILQL